MAVQFAHRVKQMRHFLEYSSSSGTVLVEVDPVKPLPGELVGKIGSGEDPTSTLIIKSRQQFESALTVVNQTAAAFVEQVSRMVDKPSQVEITFGLKATGEAGFFAITKLAGEANFGVKLTWSREEPGQTP